MWSYIMLFVCNAFAPQILWVKSARRSPMVLFIVSQFVSVGMWLERFVIIPVSLSRDYMPSAWGMYYPTQFDWATFIGTLGFFTTMMFLFIRALPMISIFEMRTLVKQKPAEVTP
jgi:molybdopterin-containing oxidoreductase family membrane subunit